MLVYCTCDIPIILHFLFLEFLFLMFRGNLLVLIISHYHYIINYKDYGKIIQIINTKLSIIYPNTCSYNILQHLHKKSQLLIVNFCHILVKIKIKFWSINYIYIYILTKIWFSFWLKYVENLQIITCDVMCKSWRILRLLSESESVNIYWLSVKCDWFFNDYLSEN